MAVYQSLSSANVLSRVSEIPKFLNTTFLASDFHRSFIGPSNSNTVYKSGTSQNIGKSIKFSDAQRYGKIGPTFAAISASQNKKRLGAMAKAYGGSISLNSIGAKSSGSVPFEQLLSIAELCAKKGSEVVLAAVDKPRTIDYKGATDLVTDTDRKCEEEIMSELRKHFPDHLVLGEEGGVSGDINSDYLWCIDPLDGTTNFAHGYPCFAVCVAVLFRGKPAASAVVEFSGGPFCWVTRTFTASAGGGAFCNGQIIHVSNTSSVNKSLLVTGFGYEHDEAWLTNISLFQHFTDVSRGVRRLGSAATDMCHVALGVVDAYWEYRLKPWDMAASSLIVEEAGGCVTRMDGGDFTVFDRSILVSNSLLHSQLLDVIKPATDKLIVKNFDFSQWLKPTGYKSDI